VKVLAVAADLREVEINVRTAVEDGDGGRVAVTGAELRRLILGAEPGRAVPARHPITVLTPRRGDFFFTNGYAGMPMGDVYKLVTAVRPGRLFTVVPVREIDDGALEYLQLHGCRSEMLAPGGDRLCVRTSDSKVYELPQREQAGVYHSGPAPQRRRQRPTALGGTITGSYYFSAGGHVREGPNGDPFGTHEDPMRESCAILMMLDALHAGEATLDDLLPVLERDGTEWGVDSDDIFFPQRDSALFLLPDHYDYDGGGGGGSGGEDDDDDEEDDDDEDED
jgi:hypothetical protein